MSGKMRGEKEMSGKMREMSRKNERGELES